MASLREQFFRGTGMGINPLAEGMAGFQEEAQSQLPPGFKASDEIDIADEVGNVPQEESVMEDDSDGTMDNSQSTDADIENIIKSKVDVDAAKRDGVNPLDVIKAIQTWNKYKVQKLDQNEPEFKHAQQLITKYKKGTEATPSGKPMPVGLRRARDLHNSNVLKYITYNIKDGSFNFDALKKAALIPPKNFLKQNDKMLHSGGGEIIFFDTKIAAYRGLYFDMKEDKFKIVKTCPSAGTCLKDCYASKGNEIKFPASNLASIQTLTLMMNDYFDFKDRFLTELKKEEAKRKGKQIVVRFHSAGDFFNEKYFDIAMDIARSCPEVDFYAYTKQVKIYAAKKGSIPENFQFILSEGGTNDKMTRELMADDPSLKKSIIVPNPQNPEGLWDSEKLRHDIDHSPGYFDKFKDFLAKQYGIDKNLIITYQQMMKIPYNKHEEHPKKYKVIVIPDGKDGDTGAYRKDVDVVLLLKH